MDTKISFRGYMAWNYDKEEAHLDKMSEKGWQLIKGGCFFSVYKMQPEVVYRNRIDYNPDAIRTKEEKRRYLELFEAQGWEFAGNTFNGWIYFRKKYVPGTPEEEYEIYTDAESIEELMKRWKRLGIIISALLVMWLGIYLSVALSGGYVSILLVMVYILLLFWVQWGMYRMKKKFTGGRD